jgi:hypothetical protein
MTPWVTHEINRTVAALAAEMRSSPTGIPSKIVSLRLNPTARMRVAQD